MNQMLAWELVYPLGALILLLAIVYGLWQYRHRNRSADRIGDRVVRDRYEHPEKWDKKT